LLAFTIEDEETRYTHKAMERNKNRPMTFPSVSVAESFKLLVGVSRVHGAFGKMSKEESPRSPPTKKGKFQEDAGRKIIPYVKTWALITLHNDFANLHPKQML